VSERAAVLATPPLVDVCARAGRVLPTLVIVRRRRALIRIVMDTQRALETFCMN